MKEKYPQSSTVFASNTSPFQSRHSVKLNFRNFFLGLAYILLFTFLVLSIFLWVSHPQKNKAPSILLDRASLEHLTEYIVHSDLSFPSQKNCTYYTCFDVYKCSHIHSGRIGVYVYPLVEYVDKDKVPLTKKITLEFHNMLKAVTNSVYFTPDPDEACLFIPTIDLLNQNRIHPKDVGKALASLP